MDTYEAPTSTSCKCNVYNSYNCNCYKPSAKRSEIWGPGTWGPREKLMFPSHKKQQQSKNGQFLFYLKSWHFKRPGLGKSQALGQNLLLLACCGRAVKLLSKYLTFTQRSGLFWTVVGEALFCSRHQSLCKCIAGPSANNRGLGAQFKMRCLSQHTCHSHANPEAQGSL